MAATAACAPGGGEDCTSRQGDYRNPPLRTNSSIMEEVCRFRAKWPIVWSVVICGFCLGASELGQNFLASRTADATDLMWGGIGISIGAGLAGIVKGGGVEEVRGI